MQIDLKNCVVKFKDGSTNSIEIKVGEGNAQWTEQKPRQYTLDRGLLSDVRDGDEVPVDVTLAFTWERVTNGSGSGATPSPIDALKQLGAASAWVSSDSDLCQPYCVDIEIVHTPPCSGNVETYLLQDFRYENLAYDLRAGTINVTGKCNVTEATATLS